MVRSFSYGVTALYLVFGVFGVLVGSSLGIGGMALGLAAGGTAAAGIALTLEKSEGRENAFYVGLSILLIVGLAWFVAQFGGTL